MDMGRVLCVLLACGFALSCAKKRVVVDRPNDGILDSEPPKNPPSVPTNPADNSLESTQERIWVGNVRAQGGVESTLQNMGIYTPDVCFQYVIIRNTSNEDAQGVLEISSVPCPGGSTLVEDRSVLLRLGVRQHSQYFTQFHLYEDSRDIRVGIFRRLTENGVTFYSLEGLCAVDPLNWDSDLHFKQNCVLNIQNSLFGNPALYID